MPVRTLPSLLSVTTLLAASLAAWPSLAKDDALLPELTFKQEARETEFIRAHYFKSPCFRNARRAAPLMKGKENMIAPAYSVELGLDDPTPDGKLHEIAVAQEHRLAYFQESTGIRDSQSAPWHGPVSLEACLKEVLTDDADH